jgi:plastocyanin
MRRIVVLASLSLLALTAVPADAGVVSVRDNRFAPDEHALTAPGQSVTWDWAAGVRNLHNIREDSSLFSSGDATDDDDASFTRTFSAGNFHYFCGIHGSQDEGMGGNVLVPVRITGTPKGLRFTVRWATASSNVGRLFDVQYRIGSGNWVTWRTDTTAFSRVFGTDGKPVVVKAERTYSFRARTQRFMSAPLGRSGWSPVRSFHT